MYSSSYVSQWSYNTYKIQTNMYNIWCPMCLGLRGNENHHSMFCFGAGLSCILSERDTVILERASRHPPTAWSAPEQRMLFYTILLLTWQKKTNNCILSTPPCIIRLLHCELMIALDYLDCTASNWITTAPHCLHSVFLRLLTIPEGNILPNQINEPEWDVEVPDVEDVTVSQDQMSLPSTWTCQ